jgi:hypothetical protein
MAPEGCRATLLVRNRCAVAPIADQRRQIVHRIGQWNPSLYGFGIVTKLPQSHLPIAEGTT